MATTPSHCPLPTAHCPPKRASSARQRRSFTLHPHANQSRCHLNPPKPPRRRPGLKLSSNSSLIDGQVRAFCSWAWALAMGLRHGNPVIWKKRSAAFRAGIGIPVLTMVTLSAAATIDFHPHTSSATRCMHFA